MSKRASGSSSGVAPPPNKKHRSGGNDTLHLLNISNVPAPAALMGEVMASTGCNVLASAISLVYEPMEEKIDADVEADTAMENKAIEQLREERDRRVAAGETLPRIPPPKVWQKANKRDKAHIRTRDEDTSRVFKEDAEEIGLEGNAYVCTVTNTCIRKVRIAFRGRGSWKDREPDTRFYPCELVVRFIANGLDDNSENTRCLEIRYLLSGDIVNDMNIGMFSKVWGVVNADTWLESIPPVFSLPNFPSGDFKERVWELDTPGDCSNTLPQELITLRNALSLYAYQNRLIVFDNRPAYLTRVYATEDFKQSIDPLYGEKEGFHYRWLHMAPFGLEEWNAQGNERLARFYDGHK